jgi:uncharacterized protein (TIGR00255 family)
MTGFGAGRGEVGNSGDAVVVELRSVNHKFLEAKIRLPRELASLEPALLKVLKARLSRGAVDMVVRRVAQAGGALEPKVDEGLAKAYALAFARLAEVTGARGDVPLAALVSVPGLVKMEEPSLDLLLWGQATEAALGLAIDGLERMRATEGSAIIDDLRRRVDQIEAWAQAIEQRSPLTVEAFRARLTERLAQAVPGGVDPQRLAQEVALMAERLDVAEELTRFSSHIAQMRMMFASPEPSGRKLEFLLQELNREVNTTGSKSQDAGIAALVIQLKAELERIREQVANLE